MTITWPVLAAVLVAAFLHAGWNILVKSSTDKALDSALLCSIGSLLALPALTWFGLPERASWPWLAASALIHVGYYFTLTKAYEHGDLGLTYPLMRGTAPLLVALLSTSLLDERLTIGAWGGVVAVCAGVLVLGLSAQARAAPHAVAFALANACLIAGYTLIDGYGARLSGDAFRYTLALFALNGWLFSALVFARRGIGVSWSYARSRAGMAAMGALASFGSYAIALWAMTYASVAVVAALREASVLFATLLGIWLLGEPLTVRRAIGALVIVCGVAALRLG